MSKLRYLSAVATLIGVITQMSATAAMPPIYLVVDSVPQVCPNVVGYERRFRGMSPARESSVGCRERDGPGMLK